MGRLGKGSFAFAFYMDRQKEERERGVTIACTTKEFFTEKWHYTIIDAPGHRDFIKNMITGASQADVALLMVPADGNFTAAIARGNHKAGEVMGQTRQHALLVNLLGVKQLIVGINKMDCDVAKYSKERYDEVKGEAERMLLRVGWKKAFVASSVPFIPMSGWKGDNLITKSTNMGWWSGSDIKVDGKSLHIDTLLDALDKMVTVPKRANDEVLFLPTHSASTPCTGKVFTVEMHHKSVPSASTGDNVGLNVKNLPKENMPRVGDVMVLKSDTTIGRVASFTAQVQILNHPGELKAGYTPIAFVRTGRSAVKITKIDWKMGKETGGQKLEDPASIKAGEMAQLVFEPQQPFVLDTFKNCEGLGRVAIMEGGTVVMLGKVIKVENKK